MQEDLTICTLGVISSLDYCDSNSNSNLSLTVGAQTNPPDYHYTGNDPELRFQLNPLFEPDPVECLQFVRYSCSITGPRTNLCDFGGFDPLTGSFYLSLDSTDYAPSGTYDFTITGVIGDISTQATFSVFFCTVDYIEFPTPPTRMTYFVGEGLKMSE